MKFNRIKSLIILLALTLTLCSNLKREESKSSTSTSLEAMLKTYSEAQTTADGGSWEKGFNCPYIYLNLSGEVEKDQGAAKIEGKLFLDGKLNENQLGLVLTFAKPLAKDSVVPQVAKQISGNKYYIPWRYVQSNFEYKNPTRVGNMSKENYIMMQVKIMI